MNRTYFRAALALATLGLMILVPVGGSLHATSSRPYGAGVWQDCTMYTLDPTVQSFPAAGGSGIVSVDTGPGGGRCVWNAQSPVAWISVDSSPQSGDRMLSYSVAANPGAFRTGEIHILASGNVVGTIIISQDGCGFAINPAGAYFSASGGRASFDAPGSAGCPGPEPVVDPTAWVRIESTSGLRVHYTVQPNTGPARSLIIYLNRFQAGGFTIAQGAVDACPARSFSFSPLSATFDGESHTDSVDLEAPTNCGPWIPVITVNWIHISPESSRPIGPGRYRVGYIVDPNEGSCRSGVIIVGGQEFPVYQETKECPTTLICRFFPAACQPKAASAAVIDVSHSFRDRILAKSERGRQYTRLYYHFSREAVFLMLSNPMLLLRSRDVITRYKPVLESMLKGEPAKLTRADLDDIDEFLGAFSEKGSAELKEALGGLRRDLKDPAVRSEFNISIVEGPKREAAAVSFSQSLRGLASPWMFVGACGLILGGFVRRPRARVLKLGKRSLLLLLPAALIAWSAPPLSARISNRTNPSAMNPAFSYLSYLGGSGDDQGTAITTDSAGNAYVAGFTSSPNFPTSSPSQGSLAGGQQDAFVCKLSPSGKLIYSTYLGGAGQDNATAIAVDSAGNAYVAGFTTSANFPVKTAVQGSLRGSVNAFVAKLDPSGSLVYSTYLGGSLGEMASSIAVDSSGNAYVAGVTTSPDFPVAGAAQAALGGASNAFLAKLSPDGSRLVYSTYLGGRDSDGASGIAVDSAGQAYVTGVTSSRNFPTVNALRPSHGGGFFDAFVAKLNAAGNQFLYSTYLGGIGEDRGLRIAVDAAGNAYVTGDTDSSDFPTANPLQPTIKGASDAFVAKLNASGSALVYSTYLGGSGLDGGTGIAVDPIGNAYVTGFTASSDFPLAAPLQQAYGGGAFDAFVAVLNPSGSGALISSYVGGSGIDSGFGVAVDSKGGLCVMGQTNSRDLPVSNAFQPSYGGDPSDVFVGRISIGPVITGAQVSGKRLIVQGIGFDDGAKVLLNGDPQKTANDEQNPGNTLVARKAGRLIEPGQTVTLQVRDADGTLSPQFSFTRQ